MSFILDALKKSENERQQQADTEFAAVPSSPDTPGAPKWLWILGLLLALNVAVLLGILLRPDAPALPAAASPPAAQAPAPQARAPERAAPQDSFTERVEEARRNRPEAAAVEPIEPPPAATVQTRQVATPEPSPVASTNTEFAALPTLTEVRVNNQVDLPDLHVDIHVYSPVPAERFVFINMTKYRENEVLREGPRISGITVDGVILEYVGVSFILPRE